MKYLITGGAGFIGCNFLHYMVPKYKNDTFICLDALTYAGNYNSLLDLLPYNNFKFTKGSITNKSLVDALFKTEKFDVVVNFAAESHVDNSIKRPGIFLKTNILGVQTLMDACLKYKVNRFHQISTDEVYGDLPLDRPDLLFSESTAIHTSSPYSASKGGADLLVMAYHRTYGLPTTISRCSNNYGPYQFPEKLIPVVIFQASHNLPIPVYGQGKNIRDWIHVHDHNVGVEKILEKGRIGEIYNLGGHSEKSNLELVRMILEKLKKPESLIQFVKDRPGHDLRYAIDTKKAEQQLGWKLSYSFENGIEQTISWYQNNSTWINQIKDGSYRNSYKA